jgi:broad specificity phosphatase PhoE
MPLSKPPAQITRLLLVRHGATATTEEDRFAGTTGIDLSDAGREQAARLAERLQSLEIDRVYSSPLARALDTARILAKPHGLDIVECPDLREISHGHWEGLLRREVEERFAEEYATWEADPFTFAPQGGEAGVAVLARALPVVRRIVVEHAGRTALVVSHKATLRLILSSLLGFDARGYRDRLDQSPACLNVVDFVDPVRARLMLFNDTSHYSVAPREAKASLSKWWDREGGEAAVASDRRGG